MATLPKRTKWLLIGGAVAIVLAFVLDKRKELQVAIAAGVRTIMDTADKLIFKAQLPSYARPYGDLILQVATEQNIDPFVLFGFLDRETLVGTAKAYVNKTGDATPRCRSQAQVNKYPSLYRVVGSCADGTLSVMPSDGLGWGRGIAQIDWEQQYPWAQTHNWQDDYTNMTQGAKLFKRNLDYFAATPNSEPVVINAVYGAKLNTGPGDYVDPRPMWGEDLTAAALAAYNSGIGQTLLCVAAGRPADYLTTGADYAQDALRRATALAANYEANGGHGTVVS